MADNLLDQLHAREVPPPPPQMQRQVHRRLNQWLLAAQTAELVLHAFGYAAVQFGGAVLGLIQYTLTGDYRFPRQKDDRDEEETT